MKEKARAKPHKLNFRFECIAGIHCIKDSGVQVDSIFVILIPKQAFKGS